MILIIIMLLFWYTPLHRVQVYMPDEEVVDTMLCDILEATEWKVGKIFDDSDSRCGEEHEMDDET